MIDSEHAARDYVASLCDASALERLETFVAELAVENQKQNLVASRSLEHVWARHIADSAQLLEYVPRGTQPWIDLGSGAGLPGLVVATMCPDREIVLVESRTRRIDWLDRMQSLLQLSNCRVLGTRLELVTTFPCAVISARAFAPLPRLLDLAERFSTDRTCWVLPKGRSAAQELASLPRRWRERFHVEQSETDPEAGIIVGSPRQDEGDRV